MTQLTTLPSQSLPALIAAAGDRAQTRFLEFFASNIRNPHTRRAYVRAVTEFLDWCSVVAGVDSIIDVEPHLAAIRHLFDWLVTGQIVPDNPAASVRGPSHVVKTGYRKDCFVNE
jgi:hypothetical protein